MLVLKSIPMDSDGKKHAFQIQGEEVDIGLNGNGEALYRITLMCTLVIVPVWIYVWIYLLVWGLGCVHVSHVPFSLRSAIHTLTMAA
jgi:hypothetical protein